MSKVIIGIHGLGNKPSAKTLKTWWKKAMHEGLNNAGHKLRMPKFELVYWADLLYKEPLDETLTDENHPLYLKEKYTKGKEPITGIKHPIRKNIGLVR